MNRVRTEAIRDRRTRLARLSESRSFEGAPLPALVKRRVVSRCFHPTFQEFSHFSLFRILQNGKILFLATNNYMYSFFLDKLFK